MHLTLKNISLKSLLFFVLFSHLVLMGLYPLMDTTEARYADIARRMWDLGDWITPWFDEGVPFWGKPPLSFWVTMVGYKLFGINEFGARFFHWIVSLLVLAVSFKSMQLITDKKQALYSVAILSSLTLFYISSTAVMTDMTLLLGGCIVLYSQLDLLKSSRLTGKSMLLMAIGLSIGLLAKGPIAVVLFMGPLFLLMIWRREWRLLQSFHRWILLILAVALIVVPWYVLAELKTPGFLEYFLVGEHWQRFVISGWHGDRYGSAHEFPRGSIWFFFLLAAIPWSLLLPYAYYKNKVPVNIKELGRLPTVNALLLLWVLMPMLFFTMSGNVLWTYVMPGFPALSMLISSLLSNKLSETSAELMIKRALLVVVTVKLAYLLLLWTSGILYEKSTKYMIEDLKLKKIALNRVAFLHEVPFSARFYSHGTMKSVDSLSEISEKKLYDYVVMTDKSIKLMHLTDENFDELMHHGKYHVFSYKLNRR